MVPIIGILGRSRCGKDTVACVLRDLMGENHVEIRHIAQPLKDAIRSLYGFSQQEIEDDRKDMIHTRYGISPRMCAQNLYSHLVTYHGKNILCRILFDAYDATISFQDKCLIIPDVRYDHDIREIQKRNGIVIKVQRSTLQHEVPHHPWENMIDQLHTDAIIFNNKSKEDLKREVNTIFNQILHSKGLS